MYQRMTGHATGQTVTGIAAVVGANLSAARRARGMTQHEVAAAIDARERMVQKWEKGKHRPHATYEQRLADLFFDGDLSKLYEPQERAA